MTETRAKTLKMVSWTLDRLISYSLHFAAWAYERNEKIYALIQQMDTPPTLKQWANRLIEHVDTEEVVNVYNRFVQLVHSGLSPEHAFKVVVDD